MNDLFIKAAEITGIVPGLLSKTRPKLYRNLSVLNVTVLIGIISYTIYNITINLLQLIDADLRLADCIMNLLLYIIYGATVVMSHLYVNVFYIKEYKQLKISFQEIDIILGNNVRTDHLVTNLKFICCLVLFIGSFVFRYQLAKEANFSMIYMCISIWSDYVTSSIITVAWRILHYLRKRLQSVNEILFNLYETPFLNVGTDGIYKRDWRMCNERSILELIEVYKRIVHIIDIFNQLYGLCIILLNLMFFIGILSIVIRLVATGDNEYVLGHDIVAAGAYSIMWLVFVVNAQYVIDEGKVLITRCLEATTFSLRLRDVVSEKWKSYLSHLTQAAVTHFPEFTAAGFYSVNVAAMFTIFNMVTGYIVVVVQFSSSK